MRWKTEALLLRTLDRVPFGPRVHYLAQRYLLRTFPLSDDRLAREQRYAHEHLAALPAGIDPHDVRALEFGAGRHLAVAVTMAQIGVAEVVASDVAALVRHELVRDTARRILDHPDGAALPDGLEELLTSMRIGYSVDQPSGFPSAEDASFDLVFSTSVMEHVPVEQIPALLADCRRILRPEGVLSLIVDYKDHYSYGDGTIPRHHFLSVPSSDWFGRYSPSNHFQNRLRHADMLRLLERAGFDVWERRRIGPTEADRRWLETALLDEPFRERPAHDLGIGEAHIVGKLR